MDGGRDLLYWFIFIESESAAELPVSEVRAFMPSNILNRDDEDEMPDSSDNPCERCIHNMAAVYETILKTVQEYTFIS